MPAIALAAKAGEVTDLSGVVLIRKPDGQTRVLTPKSEVEEGDVIATTVNSYVRVKFADGGFAVLRPESQVRVASFKFEENRPERDNVVLALLRGGIRLVTGSSGKRSPDNVRVETPVAIIGIRGTHFGLQFCNNDCNALIGPGGGSPANGLHTDVSDGSIRVTTQAGSVTVGGGQFAFVQGPAALPVLVPATQAIRAILPPQATRPAPQGGTVGESRTAECEL